MSEPVAIPDAAAGAPPVLEPEPLPRPKAITIGAVCKQLRTEFPDISISKVRYLEDRKLLAPRRTPGGYRLYSIDDVARLRTILRLQRDEFLPLRVIRHELASGRLDGTPDDHDSADAEASRTRGPRTGAIAVRGASSLTPFDALLEETGADPKLVRELEEYGVIRGEQRGGTQLYDETEREIVRAVTELARHGIAGRNLRVFRTSADREAALLEQVLAPALRSRNVDRRKEAIETLENLAAVTTRLKHLLLIRDLRKITG